MADADADGPTESESPTAESGASEPGTPETSDSAPSEARGSETSASDAREADSTESDTSASDSPVSDPQGRDSEPSPTPQSAALRRQQRLVAVGVAVLSGAAVIVAGLQQFPGYPAVVFPVAGVVTTALLYVLLSRSLFRAETD